MFEREHHKRVARVLQALDGPLLSSHGCLFGGGTAIALRHGEYRESVDMDFLVSHLPGYRALRQMLTGAENLNPITRPGQLLELGRELRADQYGLRTLVRVEGVTIKFEIVHEARIVLDAPAASDALCGVPTLTPLDMAASKLLANSDRWADEAVYSRDLIDLAMMQPSRALLTRAINKAAVAYGHSIEADLAKAIGRLRERPQRLEACQQALRMDTMPAAVLWARIRRLLA
ncbi:MAG: nucleotidyl transferase AbiEii/AbiGii toxin family protein [Burkholderiaceae bacterium]|nr:nucleotidyl transferase AbiEii/AbiGii toxin family protein [Burkholderiaceae bacterium]